MSADIHRKHFVTEAYTPYSLQFLLQKNTAPMSLESLLFIFIETLSFKLFNFFYLVRNEITNKTKEKIHRNLLYTKEEVVYVAGKNTNWFTSEKKTGRK